MGEASKEKIDLREQSLEFLHDNNTVNKVKGKWQLEKNMRIMRIIK